MGFKVVNLNPNNGGLERRILDWTRSKIPDPNAPDNVVAVDFQPGGFIIFSNTLFRDDPAAGTRAADRPNIFAVQWDPPGEARPRRGPSQHTYFDDVAPPLATESERVYQLAARDEAYQFTAINVFVDMVLTSYLTRRRYAVAPTPEVMKVLDGRVPNSLDDIAKLVCANSEFLNDIQIEDDTLTPDQISPGLREACRAILNDAASLQSYMRVPEEFLAGWEEQLTPREKEACLRAAREKQALIVDVFDHLELGRASGDNNTYILIGVDRARHAPDQQGWAWLMSQLDEFVTLNNFLPAFGCFVTEARTRYRVITGPGVTQREYDFLAFSGHELINRRNGEPIGRLADDQPVSGTAETSAAK